MKFLKYKITELKAFCRENDLKVSGNKQTLIDRLNNPDDPSCKATKNKGTTTIVVAGGVAANQYLRSSLKHLEKNHDCEFFFPSIKFCTDNGAMIALAGLERYERKLFNKLTFKPRPRWPLDKKAAFMKGKRVVGI